MKRSFLLISFFLPALFISFGSFSPVTDKDIAGDVLSYTNKFRRSKGLSALISNEELNAISRVHSENMAKGRVRFGHAGFNKRYDLARKKISNFKGFAENVAYGVNTGKEVVTMWKNSSPHRRNMLGHYKYMGIGTAKDRRGRIYYTQVFAY